MRHCVRLVRRAIAVTLILVLASAPAVAADEKPFCDVSTVDPVKPWIQWRVGTGVILGFMLVAFKNPHRSHLDCLVRRADPPRPGARAALPIWGDFMKAALASRAIRDFDVPKQGIVFQRIDRDTGLLADASASNAYFQPFIAGTEPKRSLSEHDSASEARQALREDAF